MSDERENSEKRDADELDPGEPISALAGFEHDVSSGLLVRIRHTIQRRVTLAQVAAFSVSLPLVVLRQFWSLLITRPNRIGLRKDANDGEETS
jgi:hypothetical protein